MFVKVFVLCFFYASLCCAKSLHFFGMFCLWLTNVINQGKSIMKLLELSEIQHMDIEGCIDLFC